MMNWLMLMCLFVCICCSKGDGRNHLIWHFEKDQGNLQKKGEINLKNIPKKCLDQNSKNKQNY